uniref:Ig-like domain-containing protein n=1 Tax=Oreochromis niloticus TaxID=8128 RepID=I3JJH5_ORENI
MVLLISVSNRVNVKLQHSWTQIFTGETITLRCEIQGGEGKVWKYEWTAPNTNSPPTSSEYRISRVSVSHSGDYRCRGSSDYLLTGWSDAFRLTVSFSNKVVVKQQPNWPQIFRGKTITLTCEVQEGGETTEWEYEWRGPRTATQWTHNNDVTFRVSESSSGDYMCKSRRRDDSYSSTEWSEAFTLSGSSKSCLLCDLHLTNTPMLTYEKSSEALTTQDAVFHSNGQISVSQEGLYRCRGGRGNPVYYTEDITASNRPVVTLYPNWSEIYRGETITVRCEIHGGDTEWDYEWETNSRIKAPNQNEYRIRSASSSNSGNYRCKGRMKSSQHKTTEWSDSVTLTVSDNVHSAASLTVSPDRVQHFTSDSVSLTCEGNFTEWRVRKFSEDGRLYSDCRRMTGSTCNINTSKSDTAVYWCESGSGEFSSAVNITVQNDGNGPILVSPVHPVTEGASVSLSCSLRTQKILSNVFFYHNDKLIQNDTRGELKISAVSKSDEGFYKCQYSGRESAQSWMSVKGEQDQNVLFLIIAICCYSNCVRS